MLVLGIQGEPRTDRADSAVPSPALPRPKTWYHDAAAVLLKDGALIAAIEEERLNRQKHSGRFPVAAIRFCLDQAQIRVEDLDAIAFGECGGVGPFRDPAISPERIAAVLQAEFGCSAAIGARVTVVEHHLAHALSAFACSGFAEALVVTADGFGDGVAGSVCSASGNGLAVLDRIAVKDSLGRFYGTPLAFLGFDAFSEYKVMGLAPYGDPARFREQVGRMYALLPNGRFAITARSRAEALDSFAQFGAPRPPDGAFSALYCDLAAAMQEALETMMRHLLSHLRRSTGHRLLCLAGGTAQNCAAIGKLLREGLFEDIFVQPAATDAGNAVGAAYHAALSAPGRGSMSLPRRPLTHVSLGGAVPPRDDLIRTLAAWGDLFEAEVSADVCAQTADDLANGRVVGWMQGRSEFGPRALGHRSILADPRPAENKARINSLVKKREGFRPFAPSVLEEKARTYFDLPGPPGKIFPFMTFAVPVRAEYRSLLGAVTHIDGTARVQTVSRSTNSLFWRLIASFSRLTGLPVLLNTSFNNHAEPIVESVEDAISCFLTTGLDRLVLGDVILSKRGNDDSQLELGLRLVARLAPGAVFAERDRAGNRSLKRFGRAAPLSPAAFQAIEAGMRGLAAELALDRRMAAEERRRLARELGRLWAERFINMRPADASRLGVQR